MTSPARTSAFRALLTYRKTGQVSGLQCRQSSDRHLAERIVYGVLQNERYLDFCLAQFITRGFRRLHPAALDLLRLSAYQILFLDRIPESAIVNDAVSICRDGSYSHLAGFVNAVLRRLSENKEHVLSLSAPLSVRYSHPDWMVSKLIDRFGREFTEAILNADQSIPLLCIQVNTDRCTLEDFTALLRQNDIEVLSVNRELSSVQVNSSEVEKLPGYRDGLFYIQDDAAKYSVHLADMIPGTSVLDVCAAPGGKSIAAKLEGGNPISCDISSERIRRCVENYSRLGMDIPVRIQDAGEFQPEFEAHFSLVIADVPCSGTGVIRKHPEIRYKTESEFQNLLEIQRSILDNVSRYVVPGGLLLYSTCSVMQEENEDQVEGFLCLHPEYRLVAVNQENDPCQNGMYHSWPHLTGNDGFFAAKLRRCDD